MDKLPIVMGEVFPRCVQCSLCGVEMYAAKPNPKDAWHYPHPVFDPDAGRCQNEGLKFAVSGLRVRVVR